MSVSVLASIAQSAGSVPIATPHVA
ncbi:MAG: hypothetical protein QOJ67_3596, partial [Acidimicrobiaceae bacterium]